ncbi:hypothetical protein ACMA5I_11650 [Paracoccaceae bacterium GXU_MW_L88]
MQNGVKTTALLAGLLAGGAAFAQDTNTIEDAVPEGAVTMEPQSAEEVATLAEQLANIPESQIATTESIASQLTAQGFAVETVAEQEGLIAVVASRGDETREMMYDTNAGAFAVDRYRAAPDGEWQDVNAMGMPAVTEMPAEETPMEEAAEENAEVAQEGLTE